MGNQYRVNWPMRIASILLCLVLFTTCLSSGLYARYTAKGSSGDEARVIKFGDVTLTETGDFVKNGNKNEFIVAPGFELKKDVTVEFTGSESATYLFVELLMPGWGYIAEKNYFSYGTDNMKVSVIPYDSHTGNGWNYLGKYNDSFIVYKEVSPNTVVNDKLFKELNDGNHILVSPTIIESAVNSLNGVSIKIQANVVQSNGFSSATDAWNSINSKKGGS